MFWVMAVAASCVVGQSDGGTASPPPVPENLASAAVAPPAATPSNGAPVSSLDNAPTATPAAPSVLSNWYDKVTLGGFGRIGLFYTFPFRDEAVVGGNGGFRVADARLNVGFNPVNWSRFVFSIEAAAPLPNESDPTSGQRIVSLRDWYADIAICAGFNVRAGQFRPPYYAEMLQPDGMLPFVNRSILTEGFAPPDAYATNRRGIVLDRQIGVQVYSTRLGGPTMGFRYGLGVFNGNGPNQLFNDNNAVTPVGRVELELFEKVTIGANAFYNARDEGLRPNRIWTNQLGYGADVTARFFGVRALLGFIGNSYTYGTSVLPPDSSLGFMGQLHYVHDGTNLEAAVRYAWLEPSRAQTDDIVQEVSAMVGYRPFRGPVRIVLQYEHREEEAAVAIANDSLILLLHAFF